MHVLPLDYTEPLHIEHFTIDSFLDLIAQPCAAFYIQETPDAPYRCIFNTYKFDEMDSDFHDDINVKYKFTLEQRRRKQIAENHDIIKKKHYYFMILYMYPTAGYKVIAVKGANNTYEFGALASREYLKSIQ
jgi:hypothetical protein